MNNDIIDVSPGAKGSERAQTLKTFGWVSYILLAFVAVVSLVPGGQFCSFVLVVALIMDIVKRSDADGTWQESHFSWRIRSVLWAGMLYIVTWPLWLLFIIPGWIAWSLISLWFLYRVVLGMVEMNKENPVKSILN